MDRYTGAQVAGCDMRVYKCAECISDWEKWRLTVPSWDTLIAAIVLDRDSQSVGFGLQLAPYPPPHSPVLWADIVILPEWHPVPSIPG